MSMQHLKEALSGKGDADLAGRVAGVQRDFVKRHPGESDIPLPTPVIRGSGLVTARQTTEDSPSQEPSFEHRAKLRTKYEGAMDSKEFYTPRFQKQFWTDMFADDSSIVVPECIFTADQMRRPMMDVRGNEVKPMLALVPNGFAGKEGLVRVGLRYPWLRHNTVREGTPITDRHATVGYVKVEATHNAPNLDTTEQDILDFLDTEQHPENGNVRGQREITNVIFGEALYALTGEYPDLRTISRLPGSANGDWMVYAYRSSDGRLCAYWGLDPRARSGGMGFRLEEVPSA